MKQGCLLLLAVIGIAFWGYKELLLGTELETMWWIPLLLGFVAAMVVGNFQGIVLALRHLRASTRTQVQWRDEDLVVTSGRLQAAKTPVIAPISGKPATIVEYEIARYSQRQDSNNSITDYRGCLMVPCNIQSPSGQVAVVGFPLLTQWVSETYGDLDSYQRIAKYLLTTPTEVMPKSPMAAIAQLNKVLKDDDGDVNANFRNSSVQDIREFSTGFHSFQTPNDDAEDRDSDPEYQNSQDDTNGYTNSNDPVEKAVNYFRENGYNLKETIVPNGAEVTIMGTYKAQNRQVNIGSGLSNLAHGIYLGPASKVLGQNLKKSLILTIIFTGIFLAANFFLLKKIGIEPQELLKQSQTWISGLQAKEN